jgi:hypothetical protein
VLKCAGKCTESQKGIGRAVWLWNCQNRSDFQAGEGQRIVTSRKWWRFFGGHGVWILGKVCLESEGNIEKADTARRQRVVGLGSKAHPREKK